MDVNKKSNITHDIIILLIIFSSIFLFLSVLSYSDKDPGYSHIIFSNFEQKPENMFGKVGAYTADFFGTFFGWSTIILPLLLMFSAYRVYRLRTGKSNSKFSPVAVFIFSFFTAAMLSILSGFMKGDDLYFASKHMGGIIGLVSSDFLGSLLGEVGAPIATVVLLFIMLMIFFAFSIGDVISAVRKNAAALKNAGSGINGALKKMAPQKKEKTVKNEIKTEKELEPKPKAEIKKDAPAKIDTVITDDEDELIFNKPATEKAAFDPNMFAASMDDDEDEMDDYLYDKDYIKSPNVKTQADNIIIKTAPAVETVKTVKYIIPLELLDDPKAAPISESQGELKLKSDVLTQKLADFGVNGKVREIQPGPVVTLFEFEPAPGIKINKIAGLADDLALAMSALSVRIIAPIPGKSVVGIELPNRKRATVFLKEILTSKEFTENKSPLTIAMGKDISGKAYVNDLGRMPHLLIAGTTGSGKSVAVNTMIASIIYNASPDLVKFVMIDPKMVELSIYEDIPHLAAPVVVDPKKAAGVLRNVVEEMENRYSALASLKVRIIDSYNKKAALDEDLPNMPYLVVVVDEFADLMIVAGKEVEQSIIRIAQMARAVGIHLILATQRPSVNVITGIIKANMPARLSFRVSSKTDSRTILDSNGAELLLGQGDSLFVPPGRSDTDRVHGCFLSEEEVNRLVEYVKTLGEPEYNMDLIKEEKSDAEDVDYSELDDKYNEALELVLSKGMASISMIQRYLRIGYNRAARIVEIMEKRGIVAPSDGTSRPREVLKKD